MAGATNYLQQRILSLFYGNAAVLPPANYYLALFTTAPTNTGGGVEVSGSGGSGYARVGIPNNTGRWAVSGASPASATNLVAATFPVAQTNWGAIIAIGLFDAPIGGNLHDWTLVTSKSVNIGDVLAFAPGTIVITQG